MAASTVGSSNKEPAMQMSPVIAIHMSAALAAVATGPVALWARKGARQRPMLHRAFGYAWVTLMLVTAGTALFIRDPHLPNIAGYTPIHLLVPVTLLALFGAFHKLARRDIAGHRRIMQRLYVLACIVAGAFTLLPQRYLGHLLWEALAPLLPIVRFTPTWVWLLLAGLVALGVRQARPRTGSIVAVSIQPLAMILLSLGSTISALRASPALTSALGLWLLAALALAALVAAGQAAGEYDPLNRRYALPGSWWPLALMLSVFTVRYVVAVRLALHPSLSLDQGFVLPVAALYGALSGLFLGRAAQVWRLALRPRITVAA
jgi:uncharacterized membrane protein